MFDPRLWAPAGRLLLAAIFIMSGFGKFADWAGTAGYMASKNLPAIPVLLVIAACAEILGGLSVLLGWKARWGALALILFLIPTTFIFHNFWAYQGMERQTQMINFMKNLSILGGLAMVAALGPGPRSIDARLPVFTVHEPRRRAA